MTIIFVFTMFWTILELCYGYMEIRSFVNRFSGKSKKEQFCSFFIYFYLVWTVTGETASDVTKNIYPTALIRQVATAIVLEGLIATAILVVW